MGYLATFEVLECKQCQILYRSRDFHCMPCSHYLLLGHSKLPKGPTITLLCHQPHCYISLLWICSSTVTTHVLLRKSYFLGGRNSGKENRSDENDACWSCQSPELDVQSVGHPRSKSELRIFLSPPTNQSSQSLFIFAVVKILVFHASQWHHISPFSLVSLSKGNKDDE